MNRFKSVVLLFILVATGACQTSQSDEIISRAEQQIEYSLNTIKSLQTESLVFPRTVENNSHIKLVAAKDWTSGFFPGNLWLLYELTGKEIWKTRALDYTLKLKNEQWNGHDHDIGFKMYCSFGKAIKYCNKQEYKDILVQSAKTLSTRYNPVVGCIRSWDNNPKTAKWKFPVIIDNMMNLELLMWAARETGNENFREIAIQHARTTMKNHFRKDYSSFHVVDYDPETGAVIQKNTHQGAADDSDWARGQAWALYGFTMMYRETGMEEFLEQAKHIADFLLTNKEIKKGKVPYWDFKATGIPSEPLDASAAAVISSALFELASYSGNKDYLTTAQKLLATLESPDFFAKKGQNGGFLLKHSTGSLPFNSEVDVPLVYADYYFLESLIKSKNYEENEIRTPNQDTANQ